jgi:hypothetical protein
MSPLVACLQPSAAKAETALCLPRTATARLPLANGPDRDRRGPTAAWDGIPRLGKCLAKSPQFQEEPVFGTHNVQMGRQPEIERNPASGRAISASELFDLTGTLMKLLNKRRYGVLPKP